MVGGNSSLTILTQIINFCLFRNEYQLRTSLKPLPLTIRDWHSSSFHVRRTWGPQSKYFPNPAWAGFRTTCPLVKHVPSLCVVTKHVPSLCVVTQRANHAGCWDQRDKSRHQSSARLSTYHLTTVRLQTQHHPPPYSRGLKAFRSLPPSVAL
jgi:hypothetical protein